MNFSALSAKGLNLTVDISRMCLEIEASPDSEPRDGVAVTGEEKLMIQAVENAEIVLVDAR